MLVTCGSWEAGRSAIASMALGSMRPEPGPGLRGWGETFPAAVSPPDQGWHCGAGLGGAMSSKLAEQMPFSWTSTWGNLGVPVTCPSTFCLLKGSGRSLIDSPLLQSGWTSPPILSS